MTEALRVDGGELPSTTGVSAPPTRLLRAGRPVAHGLLRGWFDLEIRGAELVPVSGPVVLAANHVGWIDGPMLAICSPRPVHALTKLEMFRGPLKPFLLRAGQIPLDRFNVDLHAIRLALATLHRGGAVGVFPEGTRGSGDMTSPRAGAAYLGLVTGAPIVPVSFLGTRLPGGSSSSIPPRGSRVAITYGEPVHLQPRPWPRTQTEIAEAAAEVTAAIVRTTRAAQDLTGLTLPGPLGPRRTKKKRR